MSTRACVRQRTVPAPGEGQAGGMPLHFTEPSCGPRAASRHALLWVACLVGFGGAAQGAAPELLRERFAAVSAQATRTVADRPVYLQSNETPDSLQGEVFALVERPYADVRRALAQADQWCDILILHLNVKYCRASGAPAAEVLDVGIGRKLDQPLAEVSWVKFHYRVARSDADCLDVTLQARSGPLGTEDYRIAVEAVPYSARQALVHLRYAYRFGAAARWSMKAYLATIGSDKFGFSIVGQRTDGQPIRVSGMRGVLERNTMRYHLAIEAHVMNIGLPPAQRLTQSLEDWFSATERYAPQLHEMDRGSYLAMKQRELQRQATELPPVRAD